MGNTTLWSSAIGDINFPMSAPPSTGAPGSLDNMTIGATTPAAATVTTLTTTGLATLASAKLDTGTKTASATAGAATLNKNAGIITSEALTTAAGATYTLTLTDSSILATDEVFASIGNGTNTAGTPNLASCTVTANQIVVVVQNIHATAAFNGTLKITFAALRA